MTVTENELVRRRKLVYQSMHGFAGEDVVDSALALLDAEFSGDEFTANRFVTRLQQMIGPRVNLGVVFSRLLQLKDKPVEQLGSDPGVRTGYKAPPTKPAAPGSAKSPAVSAVAIAPTLSDRDKVFNHLWNGLTEQLVRYGADCLPGMISNLRIKMPSLRLSTRCLADAKAWCDQPTASNPIIGTDDDMRQLVHCTYVWLCEKFGPQPADRILSLVVRQTELLPEAVHHPPRRVL
jgi:hypothetical protein